MSQILPTILLHTQSMYFFFSKTVLLGHSISRWIGDTTLV